jgi:hypothetical protein
MSRQVTKSKAQKKDWRRYAWYILTGAVALSMILGSLLPVLAPSPAYVPPTPTPVTPTPRSSLDVRIAVLPFTEIMCTWG